MLKVRCRLAVLGQMPGKVFEGEDLTLELIYGILNTVLNFPNHCLSRERERLLKSFYILGNENLMARNSDHQATCTRAKLHVKAFDTNKKTLMMHSS